MHQIAIVAVAVAVVVSTSTSSKRAMGGGDASGAGALEEEEQEQKRAAAAAYDYEGDARWADYWSNVLVPRHLVAKPEVLGHFRRKFYQRYIDRDLVVQPMSSTGSTQPSRPDVRSSPPASSESVRARSSDYGVGVESEYPDDQYHYPAEQVAEEYPGNQEGFYVDVDE